MYVQRRGRFALALSLLKSYTSGLVIWKGCCAGQTHTDREKERERRRDVFIVSEPLSLLICLCHVLTLHLIYSFPSSAKSAKESPFRPTQTWACRSTHTHSQVQQDKQLHTVDKKAAMTTKKQHNGVMLKNCPEITSPPVDKHLNSVLFHTLLVGTSKLFLINTLSVLCYHNFIIV